MTNSESRQLHAGMVGMGMIFEERIGRSSNGTHREGLYDRRFGVVDVPLAAVATRTGARAEAYRKSAGSGIHSFVSHSGEDAVAKMLDAGVDFACVATPDDRHFDAAKRILDAGVHVLIEKPSVLKLQELDELVALARRKSLLAKVVYHKLLDPDHKKLRTAGRRQRPEACKTPATARCWNRSRFPDRSFRNGSSAETPAPTWRVTISS